MHPELIAFWQDRFRDHALFLFLLLDQSKVPELKNEALRQYQVWNQVFSGPYSQVPQLSIILQLRSLKQAILSVAATQNINLVLPPTDFVDLVQHMLYELDFVVRMINGEITPQEEVAFWTQENAQHTQLAARALPPGELKNSGFQMSQQLISQPLAQILPLIHASNEMALQLDQLIRAGQIATVLHPMLLEHEIKEAQAGEQRIRSIINQ